ncbi:DUF2799 domain-containing protein [Photobacterium japonica]|uniref:DUF2799 domain-containing protein n=1 Tax=Photobacterium japonica TaxID=2910235 RepID=UPI003D0CFD43
MAKWVKHVFIVGIIMGWVGLLAACTSPYETQLAAEKEWEKLGSYHGEQGYRELNQKDLLKQGAWGDIDYEEYRAGYLQGRFEYCKGKRDVTVRINPAYPDECEDSPSQYGLVERGY